MEKRASRGDVQASKGECQAPGIQLGLHELWSAEFRLQMLHSTKLQTFKRNSLTDRSLSTDNPVISSSCLLVFVGVTGMNLWSVLLVL